jgi:hypothetical protein
MAKILGLLLAAAGVGIILYFISKKSGTAEAEPYTVNVGEGTEALTLTPGTHCLTWRDGKMVEVPCDEETAGLTDTSTEIPSTPVAEIGTPENPLTAEIPGELIPQTGPGSWYEIRKIEEILGWTPEQYEAEIEYIRTIPGEERTVEENYAGGYAENMAQAQNQVDFAAMNAQLGGSYQAGILTPPMWWEGSVTGWANYVRNTLNTGVAQ